jgi:hypothetical protein
MSFYKYTGSLTIVIFAFFTSCSTLEEASKHGLTSGYYTMESGGNTKKVYVDITEENISIYNRKGKYIDKDDPLSISSGKSDSFQITPLKLRKQSLDLDITSILLKYRPSVLNLPQQFTSDFNVAIYAGWRFDKYKIKSETDPLNKQYPKISSLAYDFGVFTGPGTTSINGFTTNNRAVNEYSGMIMQTGLAGFLESNVASFGFSVGFDYLLNRDRRIWIYQNKPWVGVIVGVALN